MADPLSAKVEHPIRCPLRAVLDAKICRQSLRLFVAAPDTTSRTELDPNIPNHYEVIEVRSIPRRAGLHGVPCPWKLGRVAVGRDLEPLGRSPITSSKNNLLRVTPEDSKSRPIRAR